MIMRTQLGSFQTCDGIKFVVEEARRPGVIKWNGGAAGGVFWQDEETGECYGYAGASCRQVYSSLLSAMRKCIAGQVREYERAKKFIERYEAGKKG